MKDHSSLEGFLSGLVFYLAITLSQTEQEVLKQVIEKYAGKRAQTIQEATVILTRIPIALDPRLPDWEPSEKQVQVLPDWLFRSLLAVQFLNFNSFLVNPEKFLSGVVVHVDETLSARDKEVLYAGVEFYGGSYDLDLNTSVTHLVSLDSDYGDMKLNHIRQKCKKFHIGMFSPELIDQWTNGYLRIIRPHYFADCFKLERRLKEDEYIVYNFSKLIDPKPEPRLELPFTPQEKFLASSTCFYIDPAYDCDPETLSTYRNLMVMAGSTVSDIPNDKVHYVVTKIQGGPVFLWAKRNRKEVGTLFWLMDVLAEKRLLSTRAKLHYYPWPRTPIAGFEKFTISISNYQGLSRDILREMLIHLGARFSPSLTKKCTHLICSEPSGAKYVKATEWNLNVLNHVWIEDCWKSRVLQAITKPQYIILKNSIAHSVGDVPVIEEDETWLESDITRRLSVYNPPNVKVMITGESDKNNLIRICKAFGIVISSFFEHVTHLVISGNLKITEKLLRTMPYCKYIVDEKWLIESEQEGSLLAEDDFIVRNTVLEEKHGFVLQDSLKLAHQRRMLDGYSVYVSSYVNADKKILENLIIAHGGKVEGINNLSQTSSIAISTEDRENHENIVLKKMKVPLLSYLAFIDGILKQRLLLTAKNLP